MVELVRRQQHGARTRPARRARRRRGTRAPRRRGRRAARRAGAGAGSRESATATARRRRCPIDSRRCTTSAWRVRPRRSSAVSASRVVTPGGAGGEVEVLADGEVVVTEGLVTHECEVAPSALAVDGEVVVEHHGFARVQGDEAREEPQQRGLARAVRAGEENDLTGGRHRDRLRLAPGNARGDRRRSGNGRRQALSPPGFRLRDSDGWSLRTVAESGRTGDTKPRSVSVSLADHAPGARSRRTHARDRRAAAPPVRGLPAVGHRHLHGASPERPEGPVRRSRSERQRHHDHEHDVPDRHHDAGSDDPVVSTPTLAPFAAPPEGDPVGSIGIPKIGVDQCVVEGVNVDDLRKGPGHYPSTQMPGSRGQQRHRRPPHHVRRTVRRSRPARRRRRHPVHDVQGDFHYKVTEHAWSTRAR